MRVTLQTALGVTVGLLVAGKVPDDQVLVATTGEQHVGAAEKRTVRKKPDKTTKPYPATMDEKFKQSIIFPSFFFFCSARQHKKKIAIGISYFSREVARQVTQPLWPSRVPRRTNCSAMMDRGRGGREEVTMREDWIRGSQSRANVDSLSQ